MATTVAWVEPEMAPKRVQAAAVVMAMPPRMWPTKASTKSSSRLVEWPVLMMSAARMNMGTESSTWALTPAMSCCTESMMSMEGM